MKVKVFFFFCRKQCCLLSILRLQGQLFLLFRNSGMYCYFMNGFYEDLVLTFVLWKEHQSSTLCFSSNIGTIKIPQGFQCTLAATIYHVQKNEYQLLYTCLYFFYFRFKKVHTIKAVMVGVQLFPLLDAMSFYEIISPPMICKSIRLPRSPI